MKNNNKNELEFIDLSNTRVIRTGDTTININKFIKWDNSTNKKGVIDKSFINLEITHNNKTMKIIIGAKDGNLWAGIASRTEKKAVQKELQF